MEQFGMAAMACSILAVGLLGITLHKMSRLEKQLQEILRHLKQESMAARKTTGLEVPQADMINKKGWQSISERMEEAVVKGTGEKETPELLLDEVLGEIFP